MKTNTTRHITVTLALPALLLLSTLNPMPRRNRVKAGQRLAKGTGLLAFFLLCVSTAFAQGTTAFTYQGWLNDSGNPAQGIYDLRFAIFDAASGGSLVAGPLTNSPTGVTNGIFTVTLDFGTVFDGTALWLEIAARTNGPGSLEFTTLSPRQPFTPVPYAITANNLSGTLPAAQVTGAIPAGQLSGTVADSQLSPNVALLNGSPAFSGTVTASAFSGNGSALTNLNASNISAGTIPDARLSTNVALLNTNQTFTGSNNFTGVVILTNTANTIAGNGSGLTNLNISNISAGTIPDARLSVNVALLNTNQTFTGSNNFTGVVILTNTANAIAGNGSGLTNLNASKISAGTIPDARLSANVALLNTNQTFTGSNKFTGVVTLANTANTIAGNGSGLTNLNASKISAGTIPDARLSPNVALLNSGTYPDARLSSNVVFHSSGVVTNGQGFSQGGSPLVLDMQASGATLTGQLWPAMPKPWKIIYSGSAHPFSTTNKFLSETNILWVINDLVTNAPNSYMAALTNDGSQVAIMLECGWDGFRNTNWSWINTNLGTLTWDTNKFPRGLPWLCSVAHSNNIKMLLLEYAQTNIVPASATTYITDDGGGGLQLWTNGFGTFPTDADGTHWLSVATPDNVQGDMQELVFWGFDGVVSSRAEQTDINYPQLSYMIGRALLQLYRPTDWLNVYPVSYFTAVTNGSQPFAWNVPMPTTFVLGLSVPPAFLLCEHIVGPASTAGYMVKANHTGIWYDDSGPGLGAAGLRRICKDFPGQTQANQGAMVMWWRQTDMASAIAQALTHGSPMAGWRNDPESQAEWPGWIACATNAQWSAINQDASQSWPILKDYGTNVGSVWFTELSSGNWAAGIFNEGATTNTFTVNWADLFWPTNLYVHVREILPDVKDWGTNLVSFATNMPAGSAALFEFDEVSPLQPGGTLSGNGAALTGLNAANLASGTVADARLSANVILRSANQTLTGSNSFAGVVTLTNTANSLAGNGTGLTSLNADQLTSGTVPLARLPGVVVTNNATGVTLFGAFNGDGSGLRNLNAALLGGQPASAFATAGHTHNFTNILGTVADEQLSTNVTLLNTSPAFAGTVTATGFSGDGSTLTNLNAGQLTSGTVADARLSTNVALLNGSPAFSTPVTMSSFLSLARTTIIPANGGTLSPAGSYVLLDPAAAVALNAVTAIASGARAGDVLILQGNSDENTVTVPNNANTKLTAASHVLGANDMLVLMWTGTAWTELSFANN